MRILIVSALFPPDVAAPAPYVKELAARLAQHHDVTVITYGFIPEAIPGVEIIPIPKDRLAPVRLSAMQRAIWSYAHEADVVLVQNAPSTELPAWLASWYVKSDWYLLHSDEKIVYRGWRRWLHTLATSRLKLLSITLPARRPEQHPFTPPTETDWRQYEQSWSTHVSQLQNQIV